MATMTTNNPDNQFDRLEDRRQRRAQRGGGAWLGGMLLILLGLLLAGQNMNLLAFNNWWALFILLPAFGSFATAWRIYQTEGRFTMRARSAAIIGFMFTLVTAMFLFEMNWTTLGPILLILAGLAILVNALFPD
jgi:hypothetical protein